MKRPKNILTYIALSVAFLSFGTTSANLPSAKQMPLDHCYHWLNERTDQFLSFKYNYAAKNGGEFSFYTTAGNGAAAGAGIYCAKTLIGSYIYGDRVVRIDFVDDIVMSDDVQQVCGTNGSFYSSQATCDNQPVDVHLYSKSNEWYVIKNPKAVKSWTANSPLLVKDLNAIKAFADTTASSHIDMTLMLMQNETQKRPQKTYINPTARMDLLDILKDPKKLQQIPILSLIEMVAASGKISDAEKKKLYSTHLSRALKDSLLAYSDYENLLSKHAGVKSQFKSLIANIDYTALSNFNTVVLVSAIDKLDIDVATEKIRSLWKSLWGSKTSYESLLTLKLKKDGALIKQFDAFIPGNFDVSQVNDANIGYLLTLLDTYLPQGGAYQELTEKLLSKLVRGTHYYVANSTYEKIKNPGLGKEKALAGLFNDLLANPAKNLDLLAMSSLFDAAKASLSSDQVQKLETQISSYPIKVSPKLSYLLLEDYKAGRLKLPSLLSRTEFLDRLVERSISERTLGANTTNTYRMILSGYYSVFITDLGKATTDAAKKKVMSQAANYFEHLAGLLERSQQYNYAYASLQNAKYFANGMSYQGHPMETVFAEYGLGQKPNDATFEKLIVNGMDTGLLLYLVTNLEADRTSANKAEVLLNKVLANYISPAFQQRIKDKNFQLVDNEKRIWANFLKNEAIAPSGTIRANLCTYNGALHEAGAILAKKFPTLWPQVVVVKNQIYADCQK